MHDVSRRPLLGTDMPLKPVRGMRSGSLLFRLYSTPGGTVIVALLLFSLLFNANTPVASGLVCPSQEELEVIRLINVERANAALPALTAEIRLGTAARKHSQDMAILNFFAHDSLNGATFVDRIEAEGYIYWNRASENIAAGYGSPSEVVAGWMNSPGHRANILDPHVSAVGAGFFFEASDAPLPGYSYPFYRYWTTDFGASSDAPVKAPGGSAVARGNFNGDNIDDMAIIDACGNVFFSTNVTAASPTWNQVPGQVFSKIVAGNFNPARQGDELAGMAIDGRIFFTSDMLTWTQIPLTATLTALVSGNFYNAPGDELAGLDPTGSIFVTLGADLTTGFTRVNGRLAQLTAGDINNDGQTDLIGLSSTARIWVSNDAGAHWTQVPGTLSQIISADFNGDLTFDIAGLSPTGKLWYSVNLGATWTNVPGTLTTMTIGDFGAATAGDRMAGLSAAGKVWYTPTLPVPSWTNVPGSLTQLITGDFDGDGTDDLAGVGPDGRLYMSLDRLTWAVVAR